MYSKVVNQINNIYYENKDNFKFKFLLETNYVITYNGLIATKIFTNDWSTSIIGDTQIPEYRLSHWKIRVNKISQDNQNSWKILIGVGPNYDSSDIFIVNVEVLYAGNVNYVYKMKNQYHIII